MNVLTTWVQSPYFDPSNPNQQPIERMVQTGGDRAYATFYWNQVPTTAQLYASNNGAGLGGALSTKGTIALGLGLGALVAVVGSLVYGYVTRRAS